MTDHDHFVRGKTSEEILAHQSASDSGPIGEYLRAAAAIHSNQELIREQNASSSHLVESIGKLVASLDQASEDSGKLGTKVVFLTLALVIVGVGQILATAWPYLAWWWHHR